MAGSRIKCCKSRVRGKAPAHLNMRRNIASAAAQHPADTTNPDMHVRNGVLVDAQVPERARTHTHTHEHAACWIQCTMRV